MKDNLKNQQLNDLISEMRDDTSMLSIPVTRKGKSIDVGLINQFHHHDFIPNKWFDWERCSNAQVMIIGQDWGPYEVLKEFISDFDKSNLEDDYYRKYLFSKFSSRTEKFILKAVEGTYQEVYGKSFPKKIWDDLFFTMAVLFTRQGSQFRGNHNFDQIKSAEISYPYVKRQIDIVKPKLIIPLGNLAFNVVNKYYNLGYSDLKISKIIDNLESDSYVIKPNSNTVILPNFHPAAHVDPKFQLKIWKEMWKYV